MSNSIFALDKTDIVEFIKHSTNHDIKKELIDAILQIIPLLGHYEEEDKKLNFKVSVGIETTIENLDGRFHTLQKYIYVDKDSSEIITSKIINMIKKVAIFCGRDADVFLVQNKDIIECGVYFTDLEKTGQSEEILLKNNFLIFQNLYQRKILMLANQNQKKYICFDLDNNDNLEQNLDQTIHTHLEATICRTWKGLFERVKKTVHGTICLIVDEKWNSSTDTNFTDHIHELNISLSRAENINADKFQDFENKANLFLSMLNYDGITIIDTNENIRAYNVFCKIENDGLNVISGGARHRAYSFLKNLSAEKCINYEAIYFQSQEGIINFYEFSNKKESHSFNPLIMNGNTNNPFYKIVKEFYKRLKETKDDFSTMDPNEYVNYTALDDLVDKLQNAHNGIDNFYNEPEPAKKLLEALIKPEFINIIKKFHIIRKKIINIVISCIIGNSYGYSRSAQDTLWGILKIIDSDCWKYYFDNKQYLERNLLWVLSYDKLFPRWRLILDFIESSYPYLSKTKDFSHSHRDFEYMDRAIDEIESLTQ